MRVVSRSFHQNPLLWALLVATWIAGGVITIHAWEQSRQTHSALCGYHDSLQDDVQRSAKFLSTHPQSVIHIGDVTITRVSLLRTLQTQRKRLMSLDGLHC